MSNGNGSGTGLRSDLLAVIYLLTGAYISLSITFDGVRSTRLAMILSGLVFSVLFAYGYSLDRDALTLTEARSVFIVALLAVMARLLFTAVGAASGQSLTLFALPTNSYLSIIGELSPTGRLLANTDLAALGETALIIAGAYLSADTLKDQGIPPLVSFTGVSILFGYGFAQLHGVTNLAFTVTAIVSFTVWFAVSYGESTDIIDVPFVVGTSVLAFELHRSHNILALGGNIQYYSGLLAARGGDVFSIGSAAQVVLVRDALIAVLAVGGFYVLWRDGLNILDG